jgi:hypothetical protein
MLSATSITAAATLHVPFVSEDAEGRTMTALLYNLSPSVACIKLTFVLCHEDVCMSGSIPPPLLNFVLERGELSASRSGRFTFKERATRTRSRLVGRRDGLGAVEREIESGPSTTLSSRYNVCYPDRRKWC